jgi:biotin carboxylase
MQERIIILGAGVMQGPAIRLAKELGLFTVAVDGSSAAPCIQMADQFEQIDLKDKEGIEAFARSLQNTCGLGGIMTAGTDFSATVAWVAERLGLPGIPYEAALNASDKARMRACFKKAGLPSPEFITVTESDIKGESPGEPSLPFPLVVKPVDNMGGRGCRRVDIIEEYREAAAQAIRFSRSGRAIVEAFMDGPEFSVDAILYRGEITIAGLADRHIFFPPYFIEMGHTMPTAISPEQQKALLETFRAGVRALGLAGKMSVGAAKGDIKLTPCGPMIGEIAARLSGGYMSGWTYPYSSGAEPVRAAILAAIGRKPEGLVPLKTWTSAERAFISIPGTVKAVSGIDAARNRPFVKDLFLRIAEGGRVDFPQNNVSKCGNIISAALDRASAVEAAESAARSILIRLDPSDPETGEFLNNTLTQRRRGAEAQSKRGTGFPPDAYLLGPELKEALARLPDTKIAPPPLSCESLQIVPFPVFEASGLKDHAGRGVAESLEAVRELSGLPLAEFHAESAVKNPESSDNNRNNFLGRPFWWALVRGGYQGALYYIDKLTKEELGIRNEE